MPGIDDSNTCKSCLKDAGEGRGVVFPVSAKGFGTKWIFNCWECWDKKEKEKEEEK